MNQVQIVLDCILKCLCCLFEIFFFGLVYDNFVIGAFKVLFGFSLSNRLGSLFFLILMNIVTLTLYYFHLTII